MDSSILQVLIEYANICVHKAFTDIGQLKDVYLIVQMVHMHKIIQILVYKNAQMDHMLMII
jgi:hypothetical protein